MPGGYGAVLAERALDVSLGRAHRYPWPTQATARSALVEYIAWYSSARHFTVGYCSPAGFENGRYDTIKNVAVTGLSVRQRGNPLRRRQISSWRPRWSLDVFSSLALAAC